MSATRRRIVAFLAGTLAVLLALVIYGRTRPPPVLPEVPVPAASAPGAFHFTPIAGADGYRVKLSDASGRLIWTSGLAVRPPIALSPDLAGGPGALRGRHTYVIEALAGAKVIGRSRPAEQMFPD